MNRQPSHQPAIITLFLFLFLIPIITPGCATPSASTPRINTTILTSVDLVRMTDQMSESLLASDINFSSQKPFIIVADRVVNRTSQIMEQGEKQLFLTKLRAKLNQNETLKKAGAIFVARPDELSSYSENIPDNSTVKHLGPTHALTATFTSLTNVDRTIRDDTYLCSFQLQDLKSREIVWEDAYTVRYAVKRGKMW